MEHPVLPAAVRGQCWEHGLLRELDGAIEPDGSERGRDPGEWWLGLRVESSRVKFGWIMRGQVGSSRIESGSGIEDYMGDLLQGISLIMV